MIVTIDTMVDVGEVDLPVDVDIEELLGNLNDKELLEVIEIAEYLMTDYSEEEYKLYFEIKHQEDYFKYKKLKHIFENYSLDEIDKLTQVSLG